ncbi:hypothetical protein IRJ41_022939 [Triplophysa rosa]|uniref:Uncharacterized protein n=1 Tax=Triplophysa rosa TaxID=992332 RepID=A0A9W8C7F3_TRIRA|nr:hypothetical protein IRJ41_022939 [Triplophysa rosa]
MLEEWRNKATLHHSDKSFPGYFRPNFKQRKRTKDNVPKQGSKQPQLTFCQYVFLWSYQVNGVYFYSINMATASLLQCFDSNRVNG